MTLALVFLTALFFAWLGWCAGYRAGLRRGLILGEDDIIRRHTLEDLKGGGTHWLKRLMGG